MIFYQKNQLYCENHPTILWTVISSLYRFPTARCDPVTQFTCNSGRCIDILQKCDGTPDCSDSTDEVSCSPQNGNQSDSGGNGGKNFHNYGLFYKIGLY